MIYPIQPGTCKVSPYVARKVAEVIFANNLGARRSLATCELLSIAGRYIILRIIGEFNHAGSNSSQDVSLLVPNQVELLFYL